MLVPVEIKVPVIILITILHVMIVVAMDKNFGWIQMVMD